MSDFIARYAAARKAVIARDFAKLNPEQRRGVLTTEGALLLLAALVGFVAADAMREEIQRQDAGIQKSVGNMRALQSRVRTLAGMDSGVSAQLAELSDAFRFSDPVSSDATVPLEKELAVMVDELQTAVSDGDDAAAAALCRRCSATLAERNRVCKLNK